LWSLPNQLTAVVVYFLFRVVVGPKTFTRNEHEKVVAGPEPMIIVPPRHYCIIQNPVLRYHLLCAEFFMGKTPTLHSEFHY
jgi:hypothetical protein